MGNLLRKGSPHPSKPFLKIRRKVRWKAGARKFRRARRTGESKAQAICRSSSRFRAGRSHAEFTKPSAKPPGARKFRETRHTAGVGRRRPCGRRVRRRGGASIAAFTKPSTKLPGARKFREARRTADVGRRRPCGRRVRRRGATKPCGIYEAQMKRELPEATPFCNQTQCRIARSVSLSNRWILETSSATLMVSPALAWLREETRAIIFCSPVTR